MLIKAANLKRTIAIAVAAAVSFATLSPLYAADYRDGRNDSRDNRRDNDRSDRRDDRGWRDQNDRTPRWSGDRRSDYQPHVIYVPPKQRYTQRKVNRTRWVRGVKVTRDRGHAYPGFGFYSNDNDAWKFLAFTALGLVVLNELTQQQQRTHEQAFVDAAYSPIGQPVIWEDGRNWGQVTATREGQRNGQLCREFQQEVTIGGRRSDAYGTACQKPDGSWEIVS